MSVILVSAVPKDMDRCLRVSCEYDFHSDLSFRSLVHWSIVIEEMGDLEH